MAERDKEQKTLADRWYFTIPDPRTKGTQRIDKERALTQRLGQDDDDRGESLLDEIDDEAIPSEPDSCSTNGQIALADIPPHERELILPIFDGEKEADIARRLGVKTSTIRQRYHRIRHREEKEQALLVERYAQLCQRRREEVAARDAEANRQQQKIREREQREKPVRDAEARRQHHESREPERNAGSWWLRGLRLSTSPFPPPPIETLAEYLAYWRKHERIAWENVALYASSPRDTRYWRAHLLLAQAYIARITRAIQDQDR